MTVLESEEAAAQRPRATRPWERSELSPWTCDTPCRSRSTGTVQETESPLRTRCSGLRILQQEPETGTQGPAASREHGRTLGGSRSPAHGHCRSELQGSNSAFLMQRCTGRIPRQGHLQDRLVTDPFRKAEHQRPAGERSAVMVQHSSFLQLGRSMRCQGSSPGSSRAKPVLQPQPPPSVPPGFLGAACGYF